MASYQFEKYVPIAPPRKNPTPQNMKVGEIVVRKNIPKASIAALKCLMRQAMRKHAMEFSIDSNHERFVIRRDK